MTTTMNAEQMTIAWIDGSLEPPTGWETQVHMYRVLAEVTEQCAKYPVSVDTMMNALYDCLMVVAEEVA